MSSANQSSPGITVLIHRVSPGNLPGAPVNFTPGKLQFNEFIIHDKYTFTVSELSTYLEFLTISEHSKRHSYNITHFERLHTSTTKTQHTYYVIVIKMKYTKETAFPIQLFIYYKTQSSYFKQSTSKSSPQRQYIYNKTQNTIKQF